MNRFVPASALRPFIDGTLSPRTRRWFTALSLTVILTGLILGHTYGDFAANLSLFGAVLVGALIYWQGDYLEGETVYGSLVAALLSGPLLAAGIFSVSLSVTLDISALSVFASAVPSVFVSTIPVTFCLILGIVGAATADIVEVELGDRLGLGLFVLAVLGFTLILVRVEQVVPETGSLTSPMLEGGTKQQLRLYGVAAVTAGFAGLVTLKSFVRSHARVRMLLIALLVTGVVLGGAGVARVQVNVFQVQDAQSAAEQLDVNVAEVELGEDRIRLALSVTNPTDSTVTLGGGYVEVSDSAGETVTWGPMSSVGDPPTELDAGETVQLTYEVPLTETTTQEVRESLSDGGVDIEGKQSFTVADKQFSVSFSCHWTGDTCE
jgi:hypothetical protein